MKKRAKVEAGHPVNYLPGFPVRESYPELPDELLTRERLDKSAHVIHGEEHSRAWAEQILYGETLIERARRFMRAALT